MAKRFRPSAAKHARIDSTQPTADAGRFDAFTFGEPEALPKPFYAICKELSGGDYE